MLYIGTFGSFIGFSFAFGQVLQDQFGAHFLAGGKVDPVKIAYLTFLGPLLGSLARPAGGWLADRFGGARTTFWNFAVMAIAAAAVLVASGQRSLALFYAGFIALFALSGLGNGSAYKMIPAIFRALGHRAAVAGADPAAAGHDSAPAVQRGHRHRRGDRGRRRRPGKYRVPAIVPRLGHRRRRLHRLHRVLPDLHGRDLAGLPAAIATAPARRLSRGAGRVRAGAPAGVWAG